MSSHERRDLPQPDPKIADEVPIAGTPPSFVEGIAFIRARPKRTLREVGEDDRNEARLRESIDFHRN